MPELPEVETIRRDLEKEILGARVLDVKAEKPNPLRGISLPQFRKEVTGKKVEALRRRAKNLLLDLSGGRTIVLHLRLAGQLLLRKKGEPADRFVRLTFLLEEGRELRFADMRRFGTIDLWETTKVDEILNQKYGPEPLSPAFTVTTLENILQRKGGRIKVVLMDQKALAGIGNIYSDEILFAAGIHPLRSAKSLKREEMQKIYQAVQKILKEAIKRRGSSGPQETEYRDIRGEKGEQQEHHQVYRRTGLPCPQCGTAIKRIKIGGRSGHYCPQCQPLEGKTYADQPPLFN